MSTIVLKSRTESHTEKKNLAKIMANFFSEYSAEILTGVLGLNGQTISYDTYLILKK